MAGAHKLGRAASSSAKARRRAKQPEVGIAKNWTSFGAFQTLRAVGPFSRSPFHHAFNRFVLNEFLDGRRRDASTFLGVNFVSQARLNHFQAMVPTNGVSDTTVEATGYCLR